jgi:hypothetical protein
LRRKQTKARAKTEKCGFFGNIKNNIAKKT